MVTPVDRGLDEPIEVTGTVAATVTNPLPVSGSFYQATQPVSIATMPTTPVTGTFYQATQPVSGTVAVSSIPHDALTATDVVSVAKTALTTSAPAQVSVGITSAELVAANASRKGLILVNNTLNTVSIAFGAAAVLNSGITMTPGGVYCMSEYDFSTAQIRAIASLAATIVSVQEFTT